MNDTPPGTPTSPVAPPRDRTLLGAALGSTAGLVVVALLQQAAIAPPERFVVFACLGVGMAAGAAALTRRLRSVRFAVVGALALATVAHGVAGIGAWHAPGYVDGGCWAVVHTEDGMVRPEDTSAAHPLLVDPTVELAWSASTTEALTDPRLTVAVGVGGVDVPVVSTVGDTAGRVTWSGSEDVPTRLEDVRESTGLPLRGVVHLTATVTAPEQGCTLSFYVAVRPKSAFEGPVLTALWTALAALVTLTGVLAVRVRRRDDGFETAS